MIIKEIYIDGFGIYHDRTIHGFQSGLNIISGPNEHGKTTFLEFIRRVIFRFPNARNQTNLYQPLNGGQLGGRLLCTLDDGREITLERHGSKNGGEVEVTYADGTTVSGQKEIQRLLGVGDLFFKNVYAITIEELFSPESLSVDEVKSRIYGAGMDLGGVSLDEVRRKLQNKADSLFRPGGSKQPVAELRRQLSDLEKQLDAGRQSLKEYEERRKELNSITPEITKTTTDQLRLQLGRMQKLRDAFPDYVKLQAAKKSLLEIGETPDFPEDALLNMQKLLSEQENSEKALAELNSQNEILTNQASRLDIDEQCLELELDILALERSTERYQHDSVELQKMTAARDEQQARFDNHRNIYISSWREQRIPENFIFQLSLKNELESYAERFRTIAQQKIALDSLNYARSVPDDRLSPTYAIAGGAICAAGLIVMAVGLLTGYSLLTGLGIGAAVIAGLLAVGVFIFGTHKKPSVENSSWQQENARFTAEWRGRLEVIGLIPGLMPNKAIECCKNAAEIAVEKNQLKQFEDKISASQTWLDDLSSKCRQTMEKCASINTSGDIITDINLLSSKLKENQAALQKKNYLKSRHEELSVRIAAATKELLKQQQAAKDFLAGFGADNAEEFRNAHARFQKKIAIEKEIDQINCSLQSKVGIGRELDEAVARFEMFDTEKIEQQILEQENALREHEQRISELTRKKGAIEKTMETLVSHDDLTDKLNAYEQRRQQLRNTVTEWARYAVAQKILSEATEKYERERQPEVITGASKIFSSLTFGKYRKVKKPLDSDEIRVESAQNGALLNVEQLSRATREQLFLAMRLGLISAQEKNSEKMPLILDDILVNFDDDRLAAAIESLQQFAQKRQVIMLTCHQKTKDIFLKHGGVLINI